MEPTGTPPRLGFVSQWFDPERGSAAQASNIARSMVRQGFDVTVLTGFPNYPEGKLYPGYRQRPHSVEQQGAMTVHRVPLVPTHKPSLSSRLLSYGSFALSASVAAPVVLRDVDVALVHLTPATPALAAATLRALRGIPFVLHVQDLWPETVMGTNFISSRGAGLAQRLIHTYCDAMYQRASAIAVSSPGMRDKIIARGVPASKVHFAPNWADESVFLPREPDSQLRASLGLRPFTVMYAGNLGHFQALDALLDVASRTLDLPDVGYLIVGEGVRSEQIDSKIRELSLTNVSRMTAQPFNKMAEVLALGDLHYVGLADLPLFGLTLPSKIQATMACGRPILGHLRGDAERVIAEANCGVCAPPGDIETLERAVRDYSSNPSAAREAGERGLHYYKSTFSESASSGLLADLLRTAAAP